MDKDKQIIHMGSSDNIFVQSNDFIQAKYKDTISFWEMMIFGRMCTLIDPNDTDFTEYRIYIKDLISLAEVEKSGQLYERILEAATKLRKREITVQIKNELGEERVLDTYLVTGVERALKVNRSENAYISLSFHPRLKPFLLELKRDFTKFDIRNYKFLHSGTITRLYQLLKSYYDRRRRDPQFDLLELKQMLGVADKYKLYANFRIKVLDEAQRKLEAGTDIKFSYEEVKQGNRVEKILFHITENEEGEIRKLEKSTKKGVYTEGDKAAKPFLNNPQTTDLVHNGNPIAAKIMEKFNVSEKVAHDLVQKYSHEELARAIRVTERAFAAGKIKGKAAGFFVEAVRKGFKDAEEEKLETQLKTPKISPKSKPEPLIDPKNEERKALFERDKKQVLLRLSEDLALCDIVVERLHSSILHGSYDNALSLQQNLEKPLLLAAAINIVKDLGKNQ